MTFITRTDQKSRISGQQVWKFGLNMFENMHKYVVHSILNVWTLLLLITVLPTSSVIGPIKLVQWRLYNLKIILLHFENETAVIWSLSFAAIVCFLRYGDVTTNVHKTSLRCSMLSWSLKTFIFRNIQIELNQSKLLVSKTLELIFFWVFDFE